MHPWAIHSQGSTAHTSMGHSFTGEYSAYIHGPFIHRGVQRMLLCVFHRGGQRMHLEAILIGGQRMHLGAIHMGIQPMNPEIIRLARRQRMICKNTISFVSILKWFVVFLIVLPVFQMTEGKKLKSETYGRRKKQVVLTCNKKGGVAVDPTTNKSSILFVGDEYHCDTHKMNQMAMSVIWCRSYGVGHMVSGIWCRPYGVGHMVSVIWCQSYGVGHIVSVIWCRSYDVGHIVSVIWCRSYSVDY
ncbi:hypothetical protein Btru_070327 [Bulinus truncatus]|nr:hypothetical protein Btru_070327 [Bulinus truncatus]